MRIENMKMNFKIITKSLEDIRDYFEEDALFYTGEKGFGQEVVDALESIGAKDGDEIEIFYYWDDENGAGTINGRTFYEDANWNELRFVWEI